MPVLNYTMEYQQHLNWCWAAVAISVARYYTPALVLTQCQLVNLQLGRGDCCNCGDWISPWHPCNSTSNTSTAIERVGHLEGVDAAPATFQQVRTEIDNLRPLALRFGWLLGGGHAVTCSGYYQSNQIGEYLVIEDPTLGLSLMPYANVRRPYWGFGTWTHTSFTKP